MLKRKLLILSAMFLILLVVPSVFAQENATDSLESSADAQALSSDFYFDSNATNDHGEGTVDDPYRELRDGRILDNSVIHLKNGEYEFSQIDTHTNVSFIGQDATKTIVRGDGGALTVNSPLVLTNITICNLNIFVQGISPLQMLFLPTLHQSRQANTETVWAGQSIAQMTKPMSI